MTDDRSDKDAEGAIDLAQLQHDLRSPLMVIGGFARLIAEREDLSAEERRDYAERIERAAEDIRRTLDETLG